MSQILRKLVVEYEKNIIFNLLYWDFFKIYVYNYIQVYEEILYNNIIVLYMLYCIVCIDELIEIILIKNRNVVFRNLNF